MISFTLDLDPVAKGRPRFGQGRTYTPGKTRVFETTVKRLAMKHKPSSPFTGPIKVTVRFIVRAPVKRVRTYPTGRPDVDNFFKGICDSLNGVFWKDDSQIVEAHIAKVYDWATRKTGIQITIEEIES